jgi:hypothetical protein
VAAYVQLTKAEAAFRVHKSDLQIRPYGINASIAWAHSSRCVFSRMCCGKRWPPAAVRADSGDEPRQIFEEFCDISLIDVILPTPNGVEVHKRCISQPTEHLRILLQRLGMSLPPVVKTGTNVGETSLYPH